MHRCSDLCLHSQKTPHISPSGEQYVSIVRNLEKIDRVITAPHCMTSQAEEYDVFRFDRFQRLRWWHDNLSQGISFICRQSQLKIEMEVEMEIYSYWLLVNYLNHKDETRSNIDIKFEGSSKHYIHHRFWNTVEPKIICTVWALLRSVDSVSVFVCFKLRWPQCTSASIRFNCHKASERPWTILLNI